MRGARSIEPCALWPGTRANRTQAELAKISETSTRRSHGKSRDKFAEMKQGKGKLYYFQEKLLEHAQFFQQQ